MSTEDAKAPGRKEISENKKVFGRKKMKKRETRPCAKAQVKMLLTMGKRELWHNCYRPKARDGKKK